jgi:hypothetical protein
MERPSIPEPRPPLPFLTYAVSSYVAIGLIAALRQTSPSLSWRLPAVVAYIAIMLRATKYDTGDLMQNYSMGSSLGTVSFNALALCLLANPVKEYRYENQEMPTEKMPLWKRVYWVICQQGNSRGIGWNYQVCLSLELSVCRLSVSFSDRAIDTAAKVHASTISCDAVSASSVARLPRRRRRHVP